METKLGISVIVPFFNEEHTVQELHARLVVVMNGTRKPYEIIFVDDASRDATFERMKNLKPIVAVSLEHNIGHTKAFAAGVASAQYDTIVGLDGDLENFPEDIPTLLQKFNEGYDMVVGWRKNRWQGQYLTRKLPSLLANRFISYVSGAHVHDHGCFLRVYKRRVLDGFDFHGESQRMIVPYAAHHGARIAEVEVGYAPRKYGVSKFGLSRIFEVVIDVLALHFFHKFGHQPRHFFARVGFVSFFFSILAFIFMLYLKYGEGKSFITTPMPLVVALFVLMGVLFILMGLVAEIIVRRQNHEMPMVFDVREKIVSA